MLNLLGRFSSVGGDSYLGEHSLVVRFADVDSAVLHDTIEDTQTTAAELEEHFGKTVMNLVLEVTDDKTLSKEERKKLQVLNASHKSSLAKKLKLADKICNVYDILHHPPGNWSTERKLNYLTWAENVLAGLKGANSLLEDELAQLIRKGREQFSGEN